MTRTIQYISQGCLFANKPMPSHKTTVLACKVYWNVVSVILFLLFLYCYTVPISSSHSSSRTYDVVQGLEFATIRVFCSLITYLQMFVANNYKNLRKKVNNFLEPIFTQCLYVFFFKI